MWGDAEWRGKKGKGSGLCRFKKGEISEGDCREKSKRLEIEGFQKVAGDEIFRADPPDLCPTRFARRIAVIIIAQLCPSFCE
jgi:hypothetical protein